MFCFEVNNIPVIFLNHTELINKSYNNEEISCNFNLKPDLFLFTHNEPKNKVSKNKKRKLNETSTSINQTQEINELQKLTEDSLKILRDHKLFSQQKQQIENEFVQHFQEDEKIFPKLNGYNNNLTAQITKINENEYLIPSHCKFFNCDVRNLSEIINSEKKSDLIVLDPPWKNKYIRRIKKVRKALGYEMLEKESLLEIPLKNYVHEKTLLVIWCTNSQAHQNAIVDLLLPAWDMKLLAKWHWIKLNQTGSTVCDFHEAGKKQPYETIFIATHQLNTDERVMEDLGKRKVLFSVPSIIHSHKPPLYEIFRKYLPSESNCLELFARYLNPHFTSVGLEVLKLMDTRLYNLHENSTQQ